LFLNFGFFDFFDAYCLHRYTFCFVRSDFVISSFIISSFTARTTLVRIAGTCLHQISWLHNGHPVKKSRDIEVLTDCGRCSLIIHEVYLEDAGEYVCEGHNEHGTAQTSCHLTVERTIFVVRVRNQKAKAYNTYMAHKPHTAAAAALFSCRRESGRTAYRL